MTATPGRSSNQADGENNFLAEFFNSTKIGMVDNLGTSISNPISYLQEKGVLAKIERLELITDAQIKLSENEIKELKKKLPEN